ncbi:hypothetical protein MtrunA17_Chr5g0437561 [Medicago truncatula]|uniref:Uncharacterized protein n=1 Tax=Medicago truncatula TaxID=3880 RepID=A0A396I2U0_MEDTR|nr:hypothetical protein MtrunA17_Chr5g0437561 [Medicago truncatula]
MLLDCISSLFEFKELGTSRGVVASSSMGYLISSDYRISFDPVQIQSMTLASSTLQIRIHGYFGDLNIVICVGNCILSFYAINMDDVSLFTYSYF